MKIVCVGYLHGAGGAEKQIILLANALSERGHEVHLIILAENKSKYDITKTVKIHDLTQAELRKKNKIFIRYCALKKQLIEIEPDISIHYWLQSAYFCAFMNKSIPGKIIYSERGDPGDVEYNGMLGLIRSIAFKRASGFVFQSEGACNYFNEKIKNKSIVIHNSVSIPDGMYLEPCKNREKKIVTVGRLHPQKNQKLLIDAFSKIADKFPEYRLDIYGEGELESKLRNQIKQLGLENRVFLRGTKQNILDYVYPASLFVLCSDYEGMPNALMEAMAIGVPCISTDCKPGGARTLIKNGINGWIVPRDDAKLLANKIEELVLTKKQNEIIKREMIKFRTEHSAKVVFDLWENFLLNLLE